MEKTIKDLDIYISDGNYSSKYPRSEEFVKEGIPFIRGNNMVDGDISDDEMYYITPEKHAILLKGHVKAGDVLITTRGNIGQVAIVPERHEDSNINAQIVLLRTNSKSLYNRYLLWALQSHRANEQYIALQTGTALKQLPVGKLEKLSIKVADIDEQHDIANTLDKVYEVIKERRKELLLLDNLIKARFVEMFGECNNYELLGEADIFISDGNYSSKYPTADEFVTEGIPFIRASNMVNNTITDDEMYYISAEKHAELLKGHVKPNDVLIATRGAGIGKIAVVPEKHNDSNINAQIVLLRCNKDIYNPLYLSWYMKLQETQIKIQGLVSGSAQPQLPIKRLIQLTLLKPEIEMQNEFADFVHQVDKSKVVVKKALEQAQLLFDSLMQEYFG
jgi:type I restriction enzyme S subunit